MARAKRFRRSSDESYYHPDSNEWTVPIPKRRIIRPAAREHHEGEK